MTEREVQPEEKIRAIFIDTTDDDAESYDRVLQIYGIEVADKFSVSAILPFGRSGEFLLRPLQ